MTGLDNLLAPCWLGYLGCARLLRCTLFFRSTCFILWKRKKTLGLYIFNLLGKIMKKLKWVSRNIYIYIYLYIFIYILYITYIHMYMSYYFIVHCEYQRACNIFFMFPYLITNYIYIYIYIIYIFIYNNNIVIYITAIIYITLLYICIYIYIYV